jgi:hypothetical protein
MLEKPGAEETREGLVKVAVVVGGRGLLFLTFFSIGARWDVPKMEVNSLGGLLLGAVEVEEEEEEEGVWREAADG